ncbi:heterokaryon incompatibility protein [Fusarium heterosporum]|uniref:Heterokaryon incompatibility protein n=1 Tax=Fusarium heterosporum TaxID=42747 RepID=A0A8H5T846_FUSHE|nr:heterokaryon incompatibility protein [Fusarium heterosporum]
MQCVPLPKSPIHSNTEIRLFSDEGYDGKEFNTYPDRQGWSARPTEDWERLFNDPSPEFVALIERWVFFGFASHALSADASQLIEWKGNPKYPILSTKLLPSIQHRRQNTTQTQESFSAWRQGLRVHLLLCAVSSVTRLDTDTSRIRSLLDYIENCATFDLRRPSMVMATSLLIEVTGAPISLASMHEFNINVAFTWDGPLWKLLRKDGWCPSELSMVFPWSNTSSLWFLRHMKRPKSGEEHSMIHIRKYSEGVQESNTDSLCTASSCRYRRQTDESYERKHVKTCQGCDDVVAKPESLCSILSGRSIPLIAGSRDEEILFQSADAQSKYIAISHVWSDGLGNPSRNAIPTCQLLRLREIARAHHPTGLFWLDTICVPPDAAGLEEEQGIALGLMRKTYQDADAVVVLDSWVLEGSCKDKSDMENLHRIFYCAWNTRLWTFQEGALARTLLFQFRDGLYDVDQGIARLTISKSASIDFTIKPVLTRLHNQLRGFRTAGRTVDQQLKFISVSTAVRRTSVETDEALCLTALLDLDLDAIVHTEPQLRMQEFWRMLPSVPTCFVFCPYYKKMDVDRFRWAPRSLLEINASPGIHSSGLVTLDETGLCGIGTGLKLQLEDADLRSSINVSDEKQNWYLLNLNLAECPKARKVRHISDSPYEKEVINIMQVYDCRQVAIIFEEDFRGHSQTAGKEAGTGPLTSTVILLGIGEVSKERIIGRYICTGTIQEMASGDFADRAELLQSMFDENMTSLKAEDIENIDLHADNIGQNFETDVLGSLDQRDLKRLIKEGVVTARTGPNLAYDKATGHIISARGIKTKSDQKWCIS